MTENNIMETAAATEAVVPVAEEPAEEVMTAEEAAPTKKKGRGKKAALIILIAVLAIGAVTGAFLLGRNTEFDPLAIFASVGTGRNENAEPPVFLGIWSDDDYTLSVSAGGILDINGTAYSYRTEGKIIVIRDSSGTEHRLGYKKASNTLKLWLDGERDDSVSLRKEAKNEPEKLYGTWVLGEAEVTFNEDGTAEIYGKEYTFTADGFEITCVSEAGTEYMFYEVDKDFLVLSLPTDTKKTLRFADEDSLIPQLVGVWVEEYGADYMAFFDDGAVDSGFFTGSTLEDYLYGISDDYSLFVDGDSLVFDIEGYKLRCSMEIDGDTMEVDIIGEKFTYYKVSDDPTISYDEIERLWLMYSPTEAA